MLTSLEWQSNVDVQNEIVPFPEGGWRSGLVGLSDVLFRVVEKLEVCDKKCVENCFVAVGDAEKYDFLF